MLHQVFTVYDAKTGAFMRPFFELARPAAMRAFGDVVNTPDHAFNVHPEDYTLFFLGTFDDLTGVFKTEETPVSCGLAVEYKKD